MRCHSAARLWNVSRRRRAPHLRARGRQAFCRQAVRLSTRPPARCRASEVVNKDADLPRPATAVLSASAVEAAIGPPLAGYGSLPIPPRVPAPRVHHRRSESLRRRRTPMAAGAPWAMQERARLPPFCRADCSSATPATPPPTPFLPGARGRGAWRRYRGQCATGQASSTVRGRRPPVMATLVDEPTGHISHAPAVTRGGTPDGSSSRRRRVAKAGYF